MIHIVATHRCTHLTSQRYRAPELFLGLIDGRQNVPEGLVIKQEVWRVTEQQSRSWLTLPSQSLTDLLLQRPEERRKRMKGSHRLSISQYGIVLHVPSDRNSVTSSDILIVILAFKD